MIRKGKYLQARHRVIAEVLRDELQKQGLIAGVLSGLAFMAASKVNSAMRRSTRPWRMLRQFINHDYLLRNVGLEGTRNLYGKLESMLNWDYHYWLQRGSVDVEERNLGLARLFLSQARGSAPSDPFVETEWAYLLFREAIDNPRATDAQTLVDEAMGILDELIGRHSRLDSYPYHVLGSQGLSWSRRGIGKSHAKGQYLSRLKDIVLAGMEKHPKERQLSKLQKDIEREYLMIAVGNRD